MSIPNDRAAYRVLNPEGFFGPDDHLYQEGECIVFDEEPNEQLEPLNDIALKRVQVLLEKLDKLGAEAAAKHNRTYAGRPRSLDGALSVARQDENYRLTVRGVEKNVTSIQNVEPDPIPETGTINPKRGRGRPPYKNVKVG